MLHGVFFYVWAALASIWTLEGIISWHLMDSHGTCQDEFEAEPEPH